MTAPANPLCSPDLFLSVPRGWLRPTLGSEAQSASYGLFGCQLGRILLSGLLSGRGSQIIQDRGVWDEALSGRRVAHVPLQATTPPAMRTGGVTCANG